ncbi:MAG: phosphate ABC transporter permease subunit PstC, partial [Gammaproteobacteria bacterium]|nr:phosphate ABC transporter permease subunit PstC [Gammaproteobacteria bacterium]
KGETPYGTIEYKTIFAVGLVLFVITLAMNALSLRVLSRFREAYE